MRSVERIASRCLSGTGGEISANARKASGVGSDGAAEMTTGVARSASAEACVVVSLADGDSEHATVVQHSLRSVENADRVLDSCEQHGMREQKPMIAD